MHFLFRIFQKYGNTEFWEENSKQIANHTVQNYSEGIISLAIGLISKSQEIFIYAKVLNFSLKIISTGINQSTSAEFIKPHIPTILNTHIIPLLFLTEKDVEDFDGDPIEFVRRTKDISENFYSAKGAALEVITQSTRYKSVKSETAIPDYLEFFFQYCIDNLGEYLKQDQPDYRIKDSLLLAIGQMAPTLMKYDKFTENCESILKEWVFQDFSSENEFLKYRAWWIYGEFSRFQMDLEHRIEAGKCLFNAMHEHSLPIKITASQSLYRMLRNKDLKEHFKSELARILEAYLALMDSIDNDDLISGLEEIVSIYEDCIEPFAIELCQKIVENYKRISAKDTEEEYGTLGMAASTLVTTTKNILEAVKLNTELIKKLEPIIFPMIVKTLTPDGLECFDEAIEWMNIIMHSCNTVTERMWSLFPHLLKIGK